MPNVYDCTVNGLGFMVYQVNDRPRQTHGNHVLPRLIAGWHWARHIETGAAPDDSAGPFNSQYQAITNAIHTLLP